MVSEMQTAEARMHQLEREVRGLKLGGIALLPIVMAGMMLAFGMSRFSSSGIHEQLRAGNVWLSGEIGETGALLRPDELGEALADRRGNVYRPVMAISRGTERTPCLMLSFTVDGQPRVDLLDKEGTSVWHAPQPEG